MKTQAGQSQVAIILMELLMLLIKVTKNTLSEAERISVMTVIKNCSRVQVIIKIISLKLLIKQVNILTQHIKILWHKILVKVIETIKSQNLHQKHPALELMMMVYTFQKIEIIRIIFNIRYHHIRMLKFQILVSMLKGFNIVIIKIQLNNSNSMIILVLTTI